MLIRLHAQTHTRTDGGTIELYDECLFAVRWTISVLNVKDGSQATYCSFAHVILKPLYEQTIQQQQLIESIEKNTNAPNFAHKILRPKLVDSMGKKRFIFQENVSCCSEI